METVITTDINYCADLLKGHEVIAIPTETVYGLAASIYDERALKHIFTLKGRPSNNPLIVHIYSIDQLKELTNHIPEKALALAKAFWPGPLSLVLPKSDVVNSIVSAGLDTVAVRMPNHPVTLELLKTADIPLAAPSANPFTRISPTHSHHVYDYFKGQIPAILEGGPCQVGVESTIVGFFDDGITLLRRGGLSRESIESVIGPIKIAGKTTKIQAPGMHLKHYAPHTKLILSNDIPETLKSMDSPHIGVIAFSTDNLPKSAQTLIILSKSKDYEEAAQKLYSALHELDEEGLDIIVAERLPDEGLGATINDRLERAQRS